MTEPARNARNAQRLTECYPWFGIKVAKLIAALEADGERPRIQDAWRSEAQQIAAFIAGTSKLRYGFHNVTGPHGEKHALAVDLLDDDHPIDAPRAYVLRLAHHARRLRLMTGLTWGLPDKLAAAANIAADALDLTYHGPLGWDRCHVQVAGLTPTQVKHGARPS